MLKWDTALIRFDQLPDGETFLWDNEPFMKINCLSGQHNALCLNAAEIVRRRIGLRDDAMVLQANFVITMMK